MQPRNADAPPVARRGVNEAQTNGHGLQRDCSAITLRATASRGTRRPPYAAEVEAELRAGRYPNVYIMAGPQAWTRAQERRRIQGNATALVLPEGADPAAYRWPALDAVLVDAIGMDHRAMLAVAQALVRDGTRFVLVVPESGESLSAWASWSRAAA